MLPQLLALGPQVALKRRWHCFLFLSIVTTKIDIYILISINMITFARVYCNFLVTINVWLNFVLKLNPVLKADI